ncbi:MAG TPA: cytochrome c biogenesis protein CcsA [Anaeromyxobacteraceae bacterium]|nr:cytochrome c biogenesis protein CcsA [Anaeromyxobacteraceae bacterium]
MKKLTPYVAWIAAALALVGALVAAVPPGKVRGMDVQGFASLPVLEGGRVKPADSVGRNALLMIRSQQEFRFEGRTVSADEWLLDVLFRRDVANRQPVFFINDPDVLSLIGQRQSSNRYFAFEALAPYLREIQNQAQAAHGIDAKQRSRFESAIANLFERVYLYYRLQNTMSSVTSSLPADLAARAQPGAADRASEVAQLAYFRALLPAAGGKADGWRNAGEVLRAPAAEAPPALGAWARLGEAWARQDAPAFNAAAAELQAAAGARPDVVSQTGHELLYNRAQPFYAGMVIYVLALLVLFVSWLWRPQLLQRAAFGLLCGGAVVHTLGLVSRVIVQGRPPVTNLYSSAIFVGWAAVLVAIVLERVYRRGFGTLAACAAGFGTLLVAHHLASDGDTMEMMRAVLDSNFWLATHVVTITIGYSGTFLAGAIAIGYTVWKHLVKDPDPGTARALTGMTYGVVCFALLFSFVGTVLGGIWADQSWGRFWGWDPKENGALLIVLWNAIILHARWGGYVREKGIMAMAIVGNIITSLSWFGVNMLGVGLHSYGFMDSAFWALTAFCASQLALMAVCLAPPRFGAMSATASGRGQPAAKRGAGAEPKPA